MTVAAPIREKGSRRPRPPGRRTLRAPQCSAVNEGSGGEFFLRGGARLVTDDAVRAEATEWGYEPRPEYILFELGLEQAVANEYQDGNPNYRRWRAP